LLPSPPTFANGPASRICRSVDMAFIRSAERRRGASDEKSPGRGRPGPLDGHLPQRVVADSGRLFDVDKLSFTAVALTRRLEAVSFSRSCGSCSRSAARPWRRGPS
jgi:hypothetical protein